MKKKAFGVLTQSGFSLVEVMVAAGVMGVVGVGMMQLMTNMSRDQQRIGQLLVVNEMVSEIRSVMMSESACFNTLSGLVIPSTPMPSTRAVPDVNGPSIPPAVPPVLFTPGQVYNTGAGFGSRVRVTTNALAPGGSAFQLVSSGPNVLGNPKNATFRFWYQRSTGATTWSVPVSKDIPIRVVPGPGNTTARCFVEDLSESACTALGGTFNNGTGRCSTIDLALNANSSLNLGTNGRICRNGVCDTTFSTNQACPLPGQPANCVNVIGLSRGGRIMCGAAPAGTVCP